MRRLYNRSTKRRQCRVIVHRRTKYFERDGERERKRGRERERERLLSQAATATKPKGDHNNCHNRQTNQCHIEDAPFCIAIM
jgi:hypothetical protein